MKYLFYLLSGLLTLGFIYTLIGVGNFYKVNHDIKNPKAAFQVLEGSNKNLKLVDFTNYRCGGCKKMYPILQEMREIQKDVTYLPRLISLPQSPDAPVQKPTSLESLALAAGLQGRFEEFHGAFMEYPTFPIPESVISETANLYGVNYAQLVKDAQSPKVTKLLENNINDMKALSIPSIPSYILGRNIYSVGAELPNLKDILTIIAEEKE